MRDKKRFISAILMTTAMLFVGGCGKQAEPVSAEPAETVKEVDAEVSTEKSTEESLEPTPSPTALPEESVESSEAENNSENEVAVTEEESEQDLGYEIISIDDTVMYAIANCFIRSGAGTQYDKVGSLSYAQEITINGKVEAGEDKLWYVIKTEDGSTQMVSASMLSKTKPAAQTSSGNGSGSGSHSGGSTGDTGNSENISVPSENVSTSSQTASSESISSETQSGAQPEKPSEQPHEHNWAAHTNQRWVSQIVTVVDEPERYEEYGMCRIYWYNTGTWEETRDPDRFIEWAHSEYGQLYPFYHIEKNEDNPLFLGYDEQGNPSFRVDHALWSEYEFIPAVTHEEDQGYYETYVDYYYCECGATK